MSRSDHRPPMPPGLKTQIFFAVVITLCAILVLPTALSAGKAEHGPRPLPASEDWTADRTASAGTVVTSTRAFVTAEFKADAYNDWR